VLGCLVVGVRLSEGERMGGKRVRWNVGVIEGVPARSRQYRTGFHSERVELAKWRTRPFLSNRFIKF
jgi:hypothetical protein